MGRHFANGTNRFWRVLHLSGFTPVQIAPENDRAILEFGYGLTTAVSRPTKRADEISREELKLAAVPLEDKVRRYAPRHLAFLGKAAYAAIVGFSGIHWGPQADPLGGVPVWVLPNPSGLNRNFSLDSLVAAYRDFRQAIQNPHPGR